MEITSTGTKHSDGVGARRLRILPSSRKSVNNAFHARFKAYDTIVNIEFHDNSFAVSEATRPHLVDLDVDVSVDVIRDAIPSLVQNSVNNAFHARFKPYDTILNIEFHDNYFAVSEARRPHL